MNEYSLTIIHSFAARKPARRGCQEDRRMLARQIAIGFGVAVVFPLLVYYGVSTVSPAPQWSNFHEQVVYAPNPTRDELTARQEKQKAETAAWTEANRVFSLRLLCVAAPASRSDGRARLRRIPPILQRHRSPSAGFDAW